MSDVTAPCRQVSMIVAGLLAKRGIALPGETSADLRRSGLTSLDMVNVMLAIEEAFDLEIPASEMTPGNFTSIAAIQSLVEKLAGA